MATAWFQDGLREANGIGVGEGWQRVVADAGFVCEGHYLRPTGVPPARQPWLAMTCRRL